MSAMTPSPPQTRYARSGRYHIAYQVIGDGPLDVVFVPGFVSHVEYGWEIPEINRFFTRLAAFARLILFDKRGTGMSDPVPVDQLPTLEERMDDVRAVMDAAGSRRAALAGVSEGGPLCLLFAATYPDRTAALVLSHSTARFAWAEDYPCGTRPDQRDGMLERLEKGWGTGVLLGGFAPSVAQDPTARESWARMQRRAASPGAAAAVTRMCFETDARAILSAITVPTLILHRQGDRMISVENARYLARHVRGARLIECPGDDHFFWMGSAGEELDQIELFLTGELHAAAPDRVLATILFLDIVDSTARMTELGDARWREVLEQFYAAARTELQRFRGREVDTAGDDLFAAFDGPARAIRCAQAIRARAAELRLEVRSGAHTGECEVINGKLGGIAVHTGARIAAHAKAREILVSGTVKDLVAGSGIAFEDRGSHALKGLPGEWRLYAAGSPA